MSAQPEIYEGEIHQRAIPVKEQLNEKENCNTDYVDMSRSRPPREKEPSPVKSDNNQMEEAMFLLMKSSANIEALLARSVNGHNSNAWTKIRDWIPTVMIVIGLIIGTTTWTNNQKESAGLINREIEQVRRDLVAEIEARKALAEEKKESDRQLGKMKDLYMVRFGEDPFTTEPNTRVRRKQGE